MEYVVLRKRRKPSARGRSADPPPAAPQNSPRVVRRPCGPVAKCLRIAKGSREPVGMSGLTDGQINLEVGVELDAVRRGRRGRRLATPPGPVATTTHTGH